MVWLRETLALLLALLLVTPGSLFSQQTAPAAPSPVSPRGLRLLVLQGQNAVNSLPLREAVSPAVQVFDYLGQPVEGAEVTFEVPQAGPGGLFENNKNSITTRTDARGQASALFTPNTLPGSFSIRVVAKAGDQTSEATIKQTNSTKAEAAQFQPPPRHWYKDWRWWTVIAAGAGAGGYFAFRGASSSSVPTIGITPGPIVIGGR